MNEKLINYLEELLEYLEYYNNMAPFPVYDTEYVDMVRQNLEKMRKSDKDYDNAPVVACKHCGDLHIVVDDAENNVCMRCGAVNEIIIYKDIYEYLGTKPYEDS